MAAVETQAASAAVLRFLRRPGSYPHWARRVDIIETHISWIFLAGKYAYKLKKPVRFDFLDFSSLALRELACFEEVRLNSRLAPDVYITVLPLTSESDGTLALDGEGPPLDYVVQMRRLPADKSADALIRARQLSAAHIHSVSKLLIDFYSKESPKGIDGPVYRKQVAQHIRANQRALLEAVPQQTVAIRRAHSLQLRFLAVEHKLFDERVAEGRIVDGHGDLRPEHIYLNGRPKIIDCVEFSDELRTIDVVDELTFLQMECELLGDGDLGRAVLAAYFDRFRDFPPRRLLDFYRSYRAAVRAKVAAVRNLQRHPSQPNVEIDVASYLELSTRSAENLGRAALIIVGGLMGNGKSTLAAKIAESFGVEHLTTDHIRQTIFGQIASPANFNEGIYRPSLRAQVYDALFQQAEVLLDRGETVVLDGTFTERALRERAVGLARFYNAPCLLVNCRCAREIALARLRQRAQLRKKDSDGRPDLYDVQARMYEPISPSEPAVTIDTTASNSQQLRAVFAALRSLLFD